MTTTNNNDDKEKPLRSSDDTPRHQGSSMEDIKRTVDVEVPNYRDETPSRKEKFCKLPALKMMFSTRYIIAYLAFCMFTCGFMSRVTISIAMTAMVNDSALNVELHHRDTNASSQLCSEYNSSSSPVRQDGPFSWTIETQELILASYFYGFLVLQVPVGYFANRYSRASVWFFGLSLGVTGVCNVLVPVAAHAGVAWLCINQVVPGLVEVLEQIISLEILAQEICNNFLKNFGDKRSTVVERVRIKSSLLKQGRDMSTLEDVWDNASFKGRVNDLDDVCKSIRFHHPRWNRIKGTRLAGYPVYYAIMARWAPPEERSRLISIGLSGFVPSTICLVSVGYVGCDVTLGVALLTLGLGTSAFCLCGTSICGFDIAPKYAGFLSAIINCFAGTTGFLVPLLIGALTTKEGNVHGWRLVFWTTAGVSMFGLIVFSIFGTAEVQPWAQEPEGSEQNGNNRNSDETKQA
ncbi:sialin-like [Diadema antillarum]|uniref:sialin-like n=1 Tax=Diadema antillarum TaxID=105358 RepID=UPI003A862D28